MLPNITAQPEVVLILSPTTAVFANRAQDQSGAVPGISTVATYPDSLIALIPDLETISEFEILLVD